TDVPMPNVLSARHLDRIAGGLLYAATSSVPWATLIARTFDVDVKACARCGGRLEVRAVVTDLDLVRRILDAVPRMARAPPPLDSTIAYEPAFACHAREPMPACALRATLRRILASRPSHDSASAAPHGPDANPHRLPVPTLLFGGHYGTEWVSFLLFWGL